MYFKSKNKQFRNFGLLILLTLFCISGCKKDDPKASITPEKEVSVAASDQAKAVMKSAQLWQGESAGFQAQEHLANDDVSFLVHLGRVQAAIGRANSHDIEEGMSNPFTPRVLDGYYRIDSFVTGKSSSSLSLQPLLSEMASPEIFSIIVDKSSSARTQRNETKLKFRNLILRVDAIVTERFPSTKSSALAMSALHRQAGELLRTGLSVDGQILNGSQYRDALQLMEASLRLRVKKFSTCSRHKQAMDELSNNGPLGDLLDRLIILSESGKVSANAGDVFNAARKLQELGTSLPNDDAQICP